MSIRNNQVKKVLFVCSIYKPNIGGIEITIEEFSKYLVKQNINVSVLTKRYPYSLSEKEISKDVSIFRMNRPKTKVDFLESIKWIKKYQELLKADIVHIFGVRRPMPLYGLLLSRFWQVPLYATFSGGDIPDDADPESLKIWQEAKGTVVEPLLQADAYSAISKSVKRQAIKSMSKLINIDVIYGGLYIEEIKKAKKIKSKYPYILSVRRLYYSKGIDILIKAFSLIEKDFPYLKLLIIGDGPERQTLEKLVKRLELQSKIKFLGEKKLKQIYAYMKGAIAHICPSRSEGGGNVNLAAQVAGCVAIGTKIGGISEYIKDRQTGLLFPSEKIFALTIILKKVLSDKNLRNFLINNGWRNIQRFDWEEIGKQYLNKYKEIKRNYFYATFKPWSEISKKMWENICLI